VLKNKNFEARLGSDGFGRRGRIAWSGNRIGGFQVLDALTELAGDGFQVLSWGVLESATEEFLAQGGQFSVKIGKLVTGGRENLLQGTLLRNLDLGFAPGLAAPLDERGFGDAQLAPDAGKAEATKAEAEEFVTGG
jgi:hypothetical protein